MHGGATLGQLRLLIVAALAGATLSWLALRSTPTHNLDPRATPTVLRTHAPAAITAEPTPAAPEAPPLGAGGLLDLNTATAAQLEALPGIGPSRAAEIIADRTANGPFRTVDELDRVKGIGPSTLDRLRPMLRVDPALAPSPAAATDPPAAAPPARGTPVRINHATAEQLQSLPRVGPAIAQRIIDYRRLHGPFRRPEDLLRVRGIGPKFLAENRHLIVCD
jgi:competence protein ComEA